MMQPGSTAHEAPGARQDDFEGARRLLAAALRTMWAAADIEDGQCPALVQRVRGERHTRSMRVLALGEKTVTETSTNPEAQLRVRASVPA